MARGKGITDGDLSLKEELVAAVTGAALIEVIEEDVISQGDLLFIASELDGMGTLPSYAKKLRHLVEVMKKTKAGVETIAMEALSE